jgi:hypothetical protein
MPTRFQIIPAVIFFVLLALLWQVGKLLDAQYGWWTSIIGAIAIFVIVVIGERIWRRWRAS